MQINYNVTGAKRKELVQAIADFLQVRAVYLGAPTFAYEVGDCQVDAHGVLTTPSTDGAVATELLDELKRRGFESIQAEEAANTTESAPVDAENYSYTVEIPKTGFTPNAEDRLEKIIASKATLLKKALGTDTLEIARTETSLKFPWFTLHGLDGEADAYNRLVAAICKMAREQHRVMAVEKPTDNEKFSMRIFLIRLGFVGSDYKTARKILMRNLTGNSSWKSGHRPDRAATIITEPAVDEGVPVTDNTETIVTETALADNFADEKGGAPYEQ